jgi:hypothetical protein
MEQTEQTGGDSMTPTEINAIVNTVVDQRIQIFKSQLDLDLMPLRLTVQKIEQEQTENRQVNMATQALLNRTVGTVDAFVDTMTEYRRQDQVWQKELLSKFSSHVGEHIGEERAEKEQTEDEERAADSRRKWIKIGIGILGSSAFLRWVHDHWAKLTGPR